MLEDSDVCGEARSITGFLGQMPVSILESKKLLILINRPIVFIYCNYKELIPN